MTILLAVRLWIATWRPWACNLPDAAGFPCGTIGIGAADRQQHEREHHWRALTGRYVCNTCKTRHSTADGAGRCGQ